MPDDHLNEPTSVSFDLTETGIKASAKSRTIAAIDRLGGALIDNLNARVEGNTATRRAKVEGDLAVIESIVEYGIREMGVDSEQARRAFNQHFKKVLKTQENTDGVLQKAIDDLKQNPPMGEVPGEISEDFYTRFEQHSGTASTEELRSLFGNILAGEIRKPGMVSAATMHFASILDSETAKLIERVLPFVTRHGHAYIECMPTKLNVNEIAHLEMAGFWSSAKVHTIDLNDKGIAIRQVGEAEAVVIDGPPAHQFRVNIAILSPTGSALTEIIASTFDVRAFASFAIRKGATGCRVGKFEISEGEWRVTDAKNVVPF